MKDYLTLFYERKLVVDFYHATEEQLITFENIVGKKWSGGDHLNFDMSLVNDSTFRYFIVSWLDGGIRRTTNSSKEVINIVDFIDACAPLKIEEDELMSVFGGK